MATNISHTHTYCGMGMRDANISPGMRDDNSSPYICEIIYICEMGKRDDNIHMKRYCNVYVYIWASVYIGLCLCVHICILIAGFFIISYCQRVRQLALCSTFFYPATSHEASDHMCHAQQH